MTPSKVCLVALCLSVLWTWALAAVGQAQTPAAEPAAQATPTPAAGATVPPTSQPDPQAAPTTQPDPKAAPTTQPDPNVDRGAASAKELLENFHRASTNGKVRDVLGFFEPTFRKMNLQMNEAQQQVGAKADSLAKVVEEKIGKEQAAALRGMSGGDMLDQSVGSPLAEAVVDDKLDWSKVKIEEKGEKAEVSVNGEPTGMPLVKVGGKWYVDSPMEMNPLQAAMMMAMLKQQLRKMTDALDQVEQRVKSGQITKDNFEQEFGRLMESASGGMGG